MVRLRIKVRVSFRVRVRVWALRRIVNFTSWLLTTGRIATVLGVRFIGLG
jgi:hypothetical protein